MAFGGFVGSPSPSSSSSSSRANKNNPNEDVMVRDSISPIDSVQALEWSPLSASNLLACASWDCSVRAYSVDGVTGASRLVGESKNCAPVLDLCWTSDGGHIASAGCDRLIKIWNPSQPTKASLVVGAHSEPIRCLCRAEGHGMSQLISGGWDRELKFWDPRNGRPRRAVGAVRLEERVYAMDVGAPLVCVALANKKVVLFDLRSAAKPLFEMVTLLKHQLRCVAIFPDRSGFAVGSVEGRCAIQNLSGDEQLQIYQNRQQIWSSKQKSFAFKCHRREQNVYAVNALKFRRNSENAFASAGGDGSVFFWDKDRKQKLRSFEKMELPVTDIDFNADGDLLAYAVSYDWSKGIEHFAPKQQKPRIFIHKLERNELSPKKQ